MIGFWAGWISYKPHIGNVDQGMLVRNMLITICHCTYRMHHQCYGSENFSNNIILLKVDHFEEFSNQTNIDKLVINITSGCSYKNYKLITKNYKLKNSLA